MTTENTYKDKTVATFIHISTFSKYFFPFGNFILPLILWTAKRNDPFVDENGKQAINFQISTFLYFILLCAIAVSGFAYWGLQMHWEDSMEITRNFIHFGNVTGTVSLFIFAGIIGTLVLGLFILEIVCVITAAMRANEGQVYKYPISINFITPTPVGKNQSKNEQFNNTQNETL